MDGRVRVLPDGTIEGSPAEIAVYLAARARLERDAPPEVGTVHVQVAASAPRGQSTLYGSAAHLPPSQRLVDPPSNELLLHKYREITGVSVKTREAYARAVEDFQRLVEPKSLLDVTIDDVRAYEARLRQNCAHLKRMSAAGRGRPPMPRVSCLKGVFAWQPAPAPECGRACPMFELQREGPGARLKGVQHFYEWLRSRGLCPANPADIVYREWERAKGGSDDDGELRKYTPSLGEVRALLRATLERRGPRDAAILLALAKWGRRPSHVLLVRGEDLHGLATPRADGLEYATFRGARARRAIENQHTKTKLLGNLVAPIDAEFARFLREVYLPFRQQEWGYAWTEGPLFPGDVTGEPYNYQQIQTLILDPAMRHLAFTAPTQEERERWRALADGAIRPGLTPGSFRSFFTTALDELGTPELDIDILRGDKVKGAKKHYLKLTPEKVCAKYRAHDLLAGA